MKVITTVDLPIDDIDWLDGMVRLLRKFSPAINRSMLVRYAIRQFPQGTFLTDPSLLAAHILQTDGIDDYTGK